MKKRIVILCGGKSGEHPISCVSAASVARTLKDSYQITPVGITRSGEWVSLSLDEVCSWNLKDLPEIEAEGRQEVEAVPGSGLFLAGSKVEADLVFPVLHGLGGEDGAVQGFLETCGLPYVGCGIFASAACMDKHYTKLILKASGIEVAPGITVDARGGVDAPAALEKIREEKIGWPVFVKPAWGGSSVGVAKVKSPEGLEGALKAAARVSWRILVEEGIKGREIECAVLQRRGEKPVAALPGEIIPSASASFYDFEAKYVDTSLCKVKVPADLDVQTSDAIRREAVKAFEAVDGRQLMRVDFFLKEDGSILVNEINTMPGFTEISMYPLAWQSLGMSYRQILVDLVENAA
ncbi:MAG: D-alanine--D-alanine ligase [Aeriscardovia sp.]|nr:D-alanine--D-alanine ligase [Aeriscardovia sp.]